MKASGVTPPAAARRAGISRDLPAEDEQTTETQVVVVRDGELAPHQEQITDLNALERESTVRFTDEESRALRERAVADLLDPATIGSAPEREHDAPTEHGVRLRQTYTPSMPPSLPPLEHTPPAGLRSPRRIPLSQEVTELRGVHPDSPKTDPFGIHLPTDEVDMLAATGGSLPEYDPWGRVHHGVTQPIDPKRRPRPYASRDRNVGPAIAVVIFALISVISLTISAWMMLDVQRQHRATESTSLPQMPAPALEGVPDEAPSEGAGTPPPIG